MKLAGRIRIILKFLFIIISIILFIKSNYVLMANVRNYHYVQYLSLFMSEIRFVKSNRKYLQYIDNQ